VRQLHNFRLGSQFYFANEADTLVNEPEIWEAICIDPESNVGLPVTLV